MGRRGRVEAGIERWGSGGGVEETSAESLRVARGLGDPGLGLARLLYLLQHDGFREM
jgi:hypothetical protein